MIKVKTEQELVLMRKACEITRDTLLMLEQHIKPGVTTKQLDKLAYDFIIKNNAKPGFLNYGGFPATICASVNNEVVHGFPSDRELKEGDIISIDVGAKYKGYNGDSARTFPDQPEVIKQRLIKQKLPQEVIDFYKEKGIYEPEGQLYPLIGQLRRRFFDIGYLHFHRRRRGLRHRADPS